MDVGIDTLIGDKCDRLAFDRVMRNRNERLYASKIDYLVDESETNDIDFRYYKFQTTLSL